MSPKTKNGLLLAGSLLAIAASGLWIYYQQFKAPKYNVALHQRIGEIVAEETMKVVGPKGTVLLITIPTAQEPELQTQLNAFTRSLKRNANYRIKEHELDTKDQPKYGLGSGLSGRRFVRAVNNHDSDAIVSFVGAPSLSKEDIASLKRKPKFVVETRSPDELLNLFDKGVLDVAIVSRFVFPAPGPLKPSTPQQWFDKRYQVITAEAAKSLPKPE